MPPGGVNLSGTVEPWDQPENGQSFWADLRSECLEFRERTYSRSACLMLKMRDHTYLAATVYFCLKNVAVAADIPFGHEVNGIDWVLMPHSPSS